VADFLEARFDALSLDALQDHVNVGTRESIHPLNVIQLVMTSHLPSLPVLSMQGRTPHDLVGQKGFVALNLAHSSAYTAGPHSSVSSSWSDR
jgi:hypothetical protein